LQQSYKTKANKQQNVIIFLKAHSWREFKQRR